MAINRMVTASLLLVATLLLQSCRDSTLYPDRNGGTNTGPDLKISDVYGVEWELEAFEVWKDGALDRQTSVPSGQRYTLTFSQQSLGGKNDCNSYGADYVLSGDNGITVSPIISTEAYCGTDSKDVEFAGILQNAVTCQVNSTTLRIFDPAVATTGIPPGPAHRNALRFKRVKGPEIQLMQLEVVDLRAGDPYSILNTRILGDMLFVTVQHSGGCKEHEFNLIGPLTIPAGDPTPITAYLLHDANGDACEALITRELSFDLTPLKERWKNVTGRSSGTIALSVNDMHSGSVGPMSYVIGGGGSKYPAWIDDSIAAIRSRPVTNPGESFWQYRFNGGTAYYRPAICCDIFSTLYDVNGNVICHPDGGIAGTGDGRCKDFLSARTDEKLIWQDPR